MIVFVVAVGLFTGGVWKFQQTNNNYGLKALKHTNYMESTMFKYEVTDLVSKIHQLAKLKSQENIDEGKAVSEEMINVEIEAKVYEYINQHPDMNFEQVRKKFKEDKELSKDISYTIIERQLEEFHQLSEEINNIVGIRYIASYEGNIITDNEVFYDSQISNDAEQVKKYVNSAEAWYKKYPFYIINKKESAEIGGSKPNSVGRDYRFIENDITLLFGLTDEFLNVRIDEWHNNRVIWLQALLFGGGFLLCIAYLIWTAGRREDGKIHFSQIDKIPLDVGLIMAIITFYVAMRLFNGGEEGWIFFIIAVLLWFMSVSKHIKNKTAWQHTLVYKAYAHIVSLTSRNWLIFIGEVLIFFITSILIMIQEPEAVAISILIIGGYSIIRLYMMLQRDKKINLLLQGVEKIRNGELDHKIEITGIDNFSEIAENINGIADGLNVEVENRLKSERLKTELITNVSHDIRTPLTSIITYIDLLKLEFKEEYVEVIEQKAQRLKTLTDDLFEAAKASSGNIAVDFEQVDLQALINQGIGELDEKIKESGLDFKLSVEKIYVRADGKLLWRVMENLLANIFKYALPHSRVYIDVVELENKAKIMIKNISNYELNIDPEELTKRFTRGDESRNSEGSGLGLAIAKNLIELQEGEFQIQIDGDLFKVVIFLNRE